MGKNHRIRRRLGNRLLASAAIAIGASGGATRADVFTVDDQASFFAAMQQIVLQRDESHTINVTGSFTMSAPVAPVVLDDGQSLTVNGNGFTIDGAGAFRPFFVSSSTPTTAGGPTTTISNLTIANGAGAGGTGSGGGMGAGGGLFVDQNTTVIVDMVSFSGNAATGGAGVADAVGIGGGGLGGDAGAVTNVSDDPSGGGGLYGAGGAGDSDEAGGGGGGALGNGGNGVAAAGGGGGGFFGNGGRGSTGDAGGGGGGLLLDGADAVGNTGGAGGGVEGGKGGDEAAGAAASNGQDGLAFGGGGGGGAEDSSGGRGGDGAFGGGGGGGAEDTAPPQGGGNGGYFGGGGGAEDDDGGNGGDFGGGGGTDFSSTAAGSGGFGGGGGGVDDSTGTAGNGGFGGGGGAGTGGTGGFGAGDGSTTGGGGGAAFGGAVFVRSGGTLVIRGSGTMGGGAASGGAGAGAGGTGAATGTGIFLQNAGVTFDPQGAGDTQTINDVIADDVNVLDPNTAATISNAGSAGGSVTKTGAGTTVLAADNLYDGGTFVQAGTLGLTGSLISDVTVNGGTFANTGTVNANGIVNGGLYNENGTTTGLVTVNGGILGGTGTVGAFVAQSGGTVAPGNSIGVLNVAGDATFQSGSIFQVEVAADGSADRVEAGGQAIINGGTVSVIAIDPATSYVNGTRSVIVNAAGGRTGTFDAIQSNVNSAFLTFTLDYNATQVLLEVRRASFGTAVQTLNQLNAAIALDQLGTSGDALLVQNALLGLSPTQARAAFDLASGEVHAGVQTGLVDGGTQFAETLRRRGGLLAGGLLSDGASGVLVAPLGYAPIAAGSSIEAGSTIEAGTYGADVVVSAPATLPPVAPEARAWIGAFGGLAEIEGDVIVPGSVGAAGLDAGTAGLAIGIEREFDGLLTGLAPGLIPGSVTLGLAAGYSDGSVDLDARLSEAEVESVHLGLYASTSLGPVQLANAGTVSFSDVETARTIRFGAIDRVARADYDALTVASSGEAMVPFALPIDLGVADTITLAPFAAYNVAHTSVDGFVETGAGALDLSAPSASYTGGDASIGLALGLDAPVGDGVATVEGRIAYERAFGDGRAARTLALAGAPAAPFTVRSVDADDDLLALGIGVGFTADRLTASARYDGAFGSNTETHRAHLSLGIRF